MKMSIAYSAIRMLKVKFIHLSNDLSIKYVQEILYHDNVKLDNSFKNSFIADILSVSITSYCYFVSTEVTHQRKRTY